MYIIYFAAWGFQHPKECAASSVFSDSSHLIAAFNAITLQDPVDKNKCRLLNQLFCGMKE